MAYKAVMRVKQIPMVQLWQLLDEQLKHGEAVLPVTGNSMWPMLTGGRDMVRLMRPNRRVRPGDVILYQRADGSHVLHRVVQAKTSNGYVCSGDNQWEQEPVPEERVLAYVIAFRRKGCWYNAEQFLSYRIYVWFWINTFSIRHTLLKFLYLLCQIRSKLVHRRT